MAHTGEQDGRPYFGYGTFASDEMIGKMIDRTPHRDSGVLYGWGLALVGLANMPEAAHSAITELWARVGEDDPWTYTLIPDMESATSGSVWWLNPKELKIVATYNLVGNLYNRTSKLIEARDRSLKALVDIIPVPPEVRLYKDAIADPSDPLYQETPKGLQLFPNGKETTLKTALTVRQSYIKARNRSHPKKDNVDILGEAC